MIIFYFDVKSPLNNDGSHGITKTKLYIIFQGTVHHVAELNGHVSSVKAVDADQDRAVTASRDRTLKVWSLVDFRNIDTTLGNFIFIYNTSKRNKIHNNNNSMR